MLAFGGVAVVGFNLAEAHRHARHGARTRQQALADVYRRDDGSWGIVDPNKELDVVSDLAAAVLFSYAALEGVGAGDRLPGLRGCITDWFARHPVRTTWRSSDGSCAATRTAAERTPSRW